ncbi:histidinol-phosphate transaminase [Wenzhouxiangella marina]|uniref:Histidinol-phosphate aminotransferase n=1 Tax=Wenzhouxiangella marina TaxID=1579979 RepID=A0A0K0Y078_9GAMM|nr:histidinol-phosphate transaminase [Wenzhouxiangella marina]AKS43344.1 Histidinol-phosphate aminotransferase [Wenzhouxiangella marina]MBB6088541.1 histidinol-phosphate aminotransferase [Wenzhouxiangella marina]
MANESMSDPILDLARPEVLALQPYASARALADSAGILLNANESPWAPDGDEGQQLNRYPDPQPPELRRRLAERYDVPEARLLITRGSDEGIDLLIRAFCRADQDPVIVCPPCFGMYALSARIQGAPVKAVPLIDDGAQWRLDEDGLRAALPARLVFLCSPNNPTGNEISSATVESLCRSILGQGLVVVDEAYIEFSEAESMSRLIDRHPNLVILRTLSKAYALAGCRLGSLIADTRVIGLLRRIIAPYPLPTPSVRAGLTALAGPDRLERQLSELAEQKKRLVAGLERLPGIQRLWPGQANFVLIRVADAEALIARAAEAGIRLRNQSAQPGLDNCVRITIGSAEETTRLLDFLESTHAQEPVQ